MGAHNAGYAWLESGWIMPDMRTIDYGIPFANQMADPDSDDWAHTVGELLPPGYERYIRVFHPFVGSDSPQHHRTTWRDLATEAGVPFGPTLTWRQLEPAIPLNEDGQHRPWEVETGRLDLAVARELFDCLDTTPATYTFAYGLSLAVAGKQPFMIQADTLADLDAVQEAAKRRADPITWPEYVWPDDMSWIVHTNYDLSSTYVATSSRGFDSVLNSPDIEATAVSPTTRVDDRADEQQS